MKILVVDALQGNGHLVMTEQNVKTVQQVLAKRIPDAFLARKALIHWQEQLRAQLVQRVNIILTLTHLLLVVADCVRKESTTPKLDGHQRVTANSVLQAPGVTTLAIHVFHVSKEPTKLPKDVSHVKLDITIRSLGKPHALLAIKEPIPNRQVKHRTIHAQSVLQGR